MSKPNRFTVPLVIESGLALCIDPLHSEQLHCPEKPACYHEQNTFHYWQQIALLPVAVIRIDHSGIYWAYRVHQQMLEGRFTLDAKAYFSGRYHSHAFPADQEYFLNNYQKNPWLMVYCRNCNMLLQAHEL